MALAAWDDFHRRWAGLIPPLRPDGAVVAGVADSIAGADDRVLLLGATPEYAGLGRSLTAVDWAEPAVARIWPGDDARRRIVRADWRALPFGPGRFTAAIGDGSLNVLRDVDQTPVLNEIARVVAPGGRVALRCYIAPDRAERVDAVIAAAEGGGIASFHAFKWRLAMAAAAAGGSPEVAMTAVHRAFAGTDRDRLAAGSGWTRAAIDEIDAYARSDGWLSFPTAAGLRAIVPDVFRDVVLRPAGAYPLAGRCPLLVMTRA